jgi:Transposase domain (DUF772)
MRSPKITLVRKIDAALDLSWLRSELAAHYSSIGRPSIDPELMIRMLVVGYVFAIRSERLICREVQVNLAYRWFCKLGIEDAIPDHSAFSRARNERFREGEIFRRMFERVVEACIAAGLVEHAPDVAWSFAGTEGFEQSRRERKKIEMRFAHLKRILKLGRLRLRGPRGRPG